MDLVCETAPLLVAERVLDGEAATLPTSPARTKGFPKAQQVTALMLITAVWPFSFEMIYPFINQVRSSPRVLPPERARTDIGTGAEAVYHGNRGYGQPRGRWVLLWLGGKPLRCGAAVHQ
jgi:hypothetical protein